MSEALLPVSLPPSPDPLIDVPHWRGYQIALPSSQPSSIHLSDQVRTTRIPTGNSLGTPQDMNEHHIALPFSRPSSPLSSHKASAELHPPYLINAPVSRAGSIYSFKESVRHTKGFIPQEVLQERQVLQIGAAQDYYPGLPLSKSSSISGDETQERYPTDLHGLPESVPVSPYLTTMPVVEHYPPLPYSDLASMSAYQISPVPDFDIASLVAYAASGIDSMDQELT